MNNSANAPYNPPKGDVGLMLLQLGIPLWRDYGGAHFVLIILKI